MSAQPVTPTKTSAVLSKLRDSYARGRFSVARSQVAQQPVAQPVADPVFVSRHQPKLKPLQDTLQDTQPTDTIDSDTPLNQLESTQPIQPIPSDFALDTANAIIENLHSRRPIQAVEVADQAVAPAVDETQAQVQPQVDPQIPAQAFPVAVDQVYQDQHAQSAQLSQSGVASRKESAAANVGSTLDLASAIDGSGGGAADTAIELGATTTANATEVGANIQYVEQERNPELPVEVEGFLQHVDDNFDQAPEEIVMADLEEPQPLPTKVPKQSVVVLPITPDQEKVAARKGTKFSVKWLVEWSRKIMKIFEGSVVYRVSDSEK